MIKLLGLAGLGGSLGLRDLFLGLWGVKVVDLGGVWATGERRNLRIRACLGLHFIAVTLFCVSASPVALIPMNFASAGVSLELLLNWKLSGFTA